MKRLATIFLTTLVLAACSDPVTPFVDPTGTYELASITASGGDLQGATGSLVLAEDGAFVLQYIVPGTASLSAEGTYTRLPNRSLFAFFGRRGTVVVNGQVLEEPWQWTMETSDGDLFVTTALGRFHWARQ